MPTYVIVGASRGLGYQYLKTLSTDSSNTVIGLARNPAAVEKQAKADNLPLNVHILRGDLTDAASLNAAATAVCKLTSAVDYLIVNGAYNSNETAGMDPQAYVGREEFFLKEMDTSMHTNVAGVLFSVNAFIELVKKSSVKKVIVISTGMADPELVAICEIPGAIPYAISKAAANVLVAKYAARYKSEGVVFLALSPGYVQTAAADPDNVPPEIAAMQNVLTEAFRKYEPNCKGLIRPEESVDMQLKVIHNITLKDSGEFLSHLGTKRWL